MDNGQPQEANNNPFRLPRKLEELQTSAAIRGIVSDALVTVVSVQWFGSEALELTYKTASGKVANRGRHR